MLAAKLAFGFVLGVALCACSDVKFDVHDQRDAGSGGSSGSGGSRDAGIEAQAGAAGEAGADAANEGGGGFPGSRVLDDFNRADGVVGDGWVGPTSEFEIHSGAARYTAGSCGPMFWGESFGAEQEAFVTLTSVQRDDHEAFVTLKAQTLGNCELIEVVYVPEEGVAGVHTCSEGEWREHEIPATFVAGDQLGGRALPNGEVEVYKNGTLIYTVATPEFRYHAQGGRIGIGCWPNNGPIGYDDFGGG